MVEGGIGGEDEAVAGGAMGWKFRDPNAHGDSTRDAGKLIVLDEPADLCGQDCGVSFGSGGRYDDVLFPAVAAQQIDAAKVARENAGNLLKNFVSQQVPEFIVDALKAVDIEHQQRHF